jgi:hypothetical protein
LSLLPVPLLFVGKEDELDISVVKSRFSIHMSIYHTSRAGSTTIPTNKLSRMEQKVEAQVSSSPNDFNLVQTARRSGQAHEKEMTAITEGKALSHSLWRTP